MTDQGIGQRCRLETRRLLVQIPGEDTIFSLLDEVIEKQNNNGKKKEHYTIIVRCDGRV